MTKITPKAAVHTALITAFTLTAAFLWRDAIVAAIIYFVPPNRVILYEFIIALIATLILILAVYLIFKTESEAKHISILIQKKRIQKERKK
jgi:hypothetical protein